MGSDDLVASLVTGQQMLGSMTTLECNAGRLCELWLQVDKVG